MRRTKHINAIIDTNVITPVNHDVERAQQSLVIVVSSKLGGAREIEHSPFIIRFGKFGMGQKTPHLLSWGFCFLSVLCVAARASPSQWFDLVGIPPGEVIAPCAVAKRRVGTDSDGSLLVETLDSEKNLTSESLLAANQWSYPYKPTTWFWASPFLVYLRTREEDANVKQLCFRNVWGKVSKCAGYALRCKNPVRVGSILRRGDNPTEEHLLTLVVELDIWSARRPLHAHLFQGTKALLSMATTCEKCDDLLPAVAITDTAERTRTRYLLMQAVDESGHHRKTIWMDNQNNELISSENFGIVEPPEIYKIRLNGFQNKPVAELWSAERPQLHKLFSHGLRPLGTRYVLRGPIWGRYCNLSSERNLIEACRHDRCVDKDNINNLLSYNLSWENAVYPMDPTETTEIPKESPKNIEIHWTTRTTLDDRSLHWTTFTDDESDNPEAPDSPKSTAEITPEPQAPSYSLTILILLMTSALFLTACVVAFFSLRLHRRSCFWRKRRPYLSHLRSAKLNDPKEQQHHSYAAVSTVTTRM